MSIECVVTFEYPDHRQFSCHVTDDEASGGMFDGNGLYIEGAIDTPIVAALHHLHVNVLSSPMSRYPRLVIHFHEGFQSFGVRGADGNRGWVGLGIFTLQ